MGDILGVSEHTQSERLLAELEAILGPIDTEEIARV